MFQGLAIQNSSLPPWRGQKSSLWFCQVIRLEVRPLKEKYECTLNGCEAVPYIITSDLRILLVPIENIRLFLDDLNFLVYEEGGEELDDHTNFDD